MCEIVKGNVWTTYYYKFIQVQYVWIHENKCVNDLLLQAIMSATNEIYYTDLFMFYCN